MKRLLGIILGTLTIGVSYLTYNYVTFDSKQLDQPKIDAKTFHEDAVTHLSEAIQIQTISYDDHIDTTEFIKFLDYVKVTYPKTFENTHQQLLGGLSMLFTWKGSDTSLKPIILMSHYDVVPVPEGNLPKWKQPPFEGKIVDGYIWGRGAIDDKVGVIGILEAIEEMIKKGYQPKRTIYLSFGHDEEVMGTNGAKQIAHFLKQKGVKAEFVLDEGGYLTEGLVPGMEKSVALIGTTEKGFVTLELSTEIEGGHASMPKKETAIDVISKALVKVHDNPFPSHISKPLNDFIEHVGPEMPFALKTVFANSNLMEPVLMAVYEKGPSSNALVRTTVAPTIVEAGIKSNVLPTQARAVLNIRIIPGESVESVVNTITKTVNDERIKIKILDRSEPPAVSDPNHPAYKLLDKSIREVFGDVVVSPYIMIAASDSRYFTSVSENVLRFCPFTLNKENIKSFHGINEKIGVEEFKNSIRFYEQVIRNADEM
ncbi:M20/M25/M40 family metallo-hydrolase [Flammeovirga sp. MY04]|uniref:M20 family peptidase n=1 Tax=Flammeovirga sp. MY04 TaxID=1191459 RepID=UPI0008061858|nr:M20 family peptidase [Flammeovirga sp. MY04]ANQ47461.1 M20/M25/M40 family metallo-hydrolase [Flammeovirga sp. MY04]